ncbi:MAG: hypothetical protein II567_12640, partial [Candidatus Riflebacteria bacterium]|nr:hypothetical protein [Candidatus Riflebacteria bacterium]
KIIDKYKNKFKYENGKILFFNHSFSYSVYLLLIGFLFLLAFALTIGMFPILLILCMFFLSSYILFRNNFALYNYYYVIDYINGIIYYDKRKGNVSVSKKIVLRTRDIISVGVDNIVKQANEYEQADLIISNQIFYSHFVFLCSDGKLFDKLKYVSSNYEDCCIFAEAFSVLFSIPILRCPRDCKLKVIKTASGYKLDKEKLKIESILNHILKNIFLFIIVICICAMYVLYESSK